MIGGLKNTATDTCLFGIYLGDGQDVAGGFEQRSVEQDEEGVCLDGADVLAFPYCQLWDNNLVWSMTKVEMYTVE